MIKLVFCLRRLPRLTRAEFQDYWRHVHAPLVAERAPILGIAQYVQCHTADDELIARAAQGRSQLPPYDGVAELWWETFERPAGYTRDQVRQAQAELLEDEARFIDLPQSPIFFTHEHEVIRDFVVLRGSA
jgi:hypothetical protein